MPPKDMGEDEIRACLPWRRRQAFLTHLATERKFAVSKVEPGEVVTGSGAVAQITLTGVRSPRAEWLRCCAARKWRTSRWI